MLTKNQLPKRLKHDANVEATIELRFLTSLTPERVVGRLSDLPTFSGYNVTRLPVADIPEPIRSVDPNLVHQATMKLDRQDGKRSAKVGPNVVSLHAVDPYPGWTKFRKEIDAVVVPAIQQVADAKVTRIGLRYINIMRSSLHRIETLSDLNFKLEMFGQQVSSEVHVTHQREILPNILAAIRIFDPKMLATPIADDAVCVIDIDVSTPASFNSSEKEEILKWIEDAHTAEKIAFFSLFPSPLIALLSAE